MWLQPQTALEWSFEGTNIGSVEDCQHVVHNPVVLYLRIGIDVIISRQINLC